jgi:pimeloyl-ACP methyl ester carboxylesterase
MMILILLQRLFGLVSLAGLAAGVYLTASWFAHRDDVVVTWARDDRWLYVGLALLAISFLGRFPALLLLGRGGGSGKRLARAERETIKGPDGSEISIETCGPQDAPVLVFTHGWGMDNTIWREAKDELSGRFRLVMWDLPGLGKSSQPADGKYAIERFAGDLRAVLAHAGDRAVLVGHSIGGMTVQTFCKLYPETLGREVAGIVLENTSHTNPLKTMILGGLFEALRKPLIEPLMHLTIWLQPIPWLMNWQGYLSGSTHVAMRIGGFGTQPTRGQLDQVSLLTTRNPPGVQAKGNLAMFHWSVTDDLGRIAVPALVFAGGRDIVTLPGAGETIAGAIAGARLSPVPHAGHMGPVELSATYNAEIAAFADEAFSRPRVG